MSAWTSRVTMSSIGQALALLGQGPGVAEDLGGAASGSTSYSGSS